MSTIESLRGGIRLESVPEGYAQNDWGIKAEGRELREETRKLSSGTFRGLICTWHMCI